MQVGSDRVLDALEGFPAYVAFVGLRDQCQPLLAGLAPIALARRAALVARRALALTVGVCAAVGRVRQHLVDGPVRWALPVDLSTRRRSRQLQAMLVEPQQRLAHRADPLELVEHQTDRLLHTPIWILLETLIFGLAIADRRDRSEEHTSELQSQSNLV